MKIVRTVLITAALAALTACSSPAVTTAPQTAATQTAAAPAASVSAAPPLVNPSQSIDPTTLGATSGYLTALGNLDRTLIADTQAALDNGQMVCINMEERRSEADQEKDVADRFSVDAAVAKKILALTKKSLCLG
jgi:ABC-type transport system substrate-binding protein